MTIQEEGDSTGRFNAAVAGRLSACTFAVVCALVVTTIAIGVHFMRDAQTYYITTPDGASREVFPLDEPNVTASSLTKWITQAVTNAYTIDFYSYQDTIDSLKQYFTNDGYKNFINSIQASGSLDKIVKEKLVVTAVAMDNAVILQEGMMQGVYTWKIQLPLLLNYQGASTTGTKKTIAVSVLVVRVPTNQAPKGIGIAQIVDGPYNAKRS
jgi:intracellular multiplication protein IcmL